LAHFAWLEFDHRLCAFYQHDGCEREQGETGFLANASLVLDALFCLELFGIGEGQGIRSDFFAETSGNSNCRGVVRDLVYRGAPAQATEEAIGGRGIWFENRSVGISGCKPLESEAAVQQIVGDEVTRL
jgi:hypothetical protein